MGTLICGIQRVKTSKCAICIKTKLRVDVRQLEEIRELDWFLLTLVSMALCMGDICKYLLSIKEGVYNKLVFEKPIILYFMAV